MLRLILCDINPTLVECWDREIQARGFEKNSLASIETHLGSIVELHTHLDRMIDAIVSPSNSRGILGGGVDGVYRRYFGNDLQNSIFKYVSKYGLIEKGEPVIIGIPSNNYRFLLMSPTMTDPGEQIIDPTVVYKATFSVLEMLFKLGWFSSKEEFILAFPGMGTGVGGFPLYKCAELMVDAFSNILIQMQIEDLSNE